MKKTTYCLIVLLVMAATMMGHTGCSMAMSKGRLKVATTTSLYDTGLWTYLERRFENQYKIKLDILAVGSGAAFTFGRNGDVDVLTVHSKTDELKFISDGYGTERVPFAYNYFIIVGPESDPAGIKGMTPEDGVRKLYASGSGKFVSRGDNSGTHSREKAVWESAGYSDYAAVKAAGTAARWYIDAGKGMGDTLAVASQKQAYTLTDESTFLTYRSNLELVSIIEGGSILLNVYSVIICTRSERQDMAQKLVDFLTSDEIQEIIGNYGMTTYGKPLFTPCAGNEPAS